MHTSIDQLVSPKTSVGHPRVRPLHLAASRVLRSLRRLGTHDRRASRRHRVPFDPNVVRRWTI